MPTGSGKSSLFKYLLGIIQKVRSKKGLNNSDPSWQLEEATFEKMGVMMSQSHSKLLGLYDELSIFLIYTEVVHCPTHMTWPSFYSCIMATPGLEALVRYNYVH